MNDLMNTSSHPHPYSNNPNEAVGNRRPARPSSAQQRSTTPTRNRPHLNTSSSGLNTTAKLEQSIMRHESERVATSTGSHKLNGKGKSRLYSTWTPLQDDETNAGVSLLIAETLSSCCVPRCRMVLDKRVLLLVIRRAQAACASMGKFALIDYGEGMRLPLVR